MSEPDPSNIRARRLVFAITWLSYASYYLCRKQLSVTKSRLVDVFNFDLSTLAAIDTGYLAAYALGQFASGLCVDALGPRRVIGVGMMAAGAATAAFGLGSTTATFAIAFTLNGLFQSTGWPGTVKAITPWFRPAERGKVMAVWSTSYQVGGIAATAVATWLLTHHGWRSTFVVPAAFTALMGGLVLWQLPATTPARIKLHAPSLAAFASVDVWILGSSYFCLKLIRYSLLFWLPLYLHKGLDYDEGTAGYVSVFFEIGGIVGALVAGTVSDRFAGRRGPVVAIMSLGLAAALVSYKLTGASSIVANCAGLALVGFMLFGPDTVVSGAAAQDLGGSDGVGAAAGVINGVGSFGGVAQGFLTAYIAKRWGWPRLFDLFIALAVGSAVILVGYSVREHTRARDRKLR